MTDDLDVELNEVDQFEVEITGGSTTLEIQDDGSSLGNFAIINVSDNLDASTNGNKVDISAPSVTDTRTDVSDSNGTVVSDTEDILFTASGSASISVTDDGDGSATVDVSATDTDTTDHSQLTNVQSDQHHTKYSDSDAISAINNDSDHGSTASHNYFSGSHQDLSNINSDDHHTKYSDEEAQDAVGTIMSGSGATSVTYDDANDTITVSSTDTDTQLSEQEVQDDAWNVLTGTQSLISVTYQDGSNEVDFSVTSDLSQYDNSTSGFISDVTGEPIGDLSNVSITTISSGDALTYDGSNWTNTDVATQTELDNHTATSDAHHAKYTDENAQDAVGTIISGGNALSATYDDAGNSISFSVESNSIQTDELDLSISPTWTSKHTFNSGLDAGSSKITSVANPTNPADAVTKQYADALEQGLVIKDSVRVASTSNEDLTTAGDGTIDGVSLNDGDRVLLKDQTTGSENGIYVANTASDRTTWTRTSDADEDSEVTSGMFMFVEEGTANGNESYILITDDPITVGTTSLDFTVFSRAGEILAGTNLSKSGNTINVDVSADFDLQTNDLVDGATTIWDTSAGEIPDSAMGSIANSTLTNSSVTIEGNSVTLGGSTSINHNDLSTISSDDHHSKTSSASELTDVSADSVADAHHAKYSDEEAQDAVGTIMSGSGATTVTYDDANNTITVSSTDNDTTYSAGSFLSLSSTTFSVNLGDGLEGDASDNIKTEEPFVHDGGAIEIADGESNSEINRIALQTGETLVIDRIEVRLVGGGSSASVSARVQDLTAASTIGSQTAGGTTKNPGSSGTANTVAIQVSNSSGSTQDVIVRVHGRITGA